jgi:hypothetical protein
MEAALDPFNGIAVTDMIIVEDDDRGADIVGRPRDDHAINDEGSCTPMTTRPISNIVDDSIRNARNNQSNPGATSADLRFPIVTRDSDRSQPVKPGSPHAKKRKSEPSADDRYRRSCSAEIDGSITATAPSSLCHCIVRVHK